MTDYYDYCDLAGKILKMDEDAIDAAIDNGEIESLFEEETGRTIEELQEIGDMLLPYTVATKSGLGNHVYQGYAKDNCFIVKRKIS